MLVEQDTNHHLSCSYLLFIYTVPIGFKDVSADVEAISLVGRLVDAGLISDRAVGGSTFS